MYEIPIVVRRRKRRDLQRQLQIVGLGYSEYRYWWGSLVTVRTSCPDMAVLVRSWFTEVCE
jgi:hypothetical protein